MTTVAIGGWQHETNTFATIRAGYDAFAMADEWPGMQTGPAMIENVRDVHLPVAGAIQALTENNCEIVPLLWCSATPCSYVTEHAFERICAKFLDLLEKALPVDAIYLDLHGAMVCEHLEDGEGELLARIRHLVGTDLPVFASLDLHANVTAKMVENATVLDIYRTYPHVDMGQTGHRVAQFLCDHLEKPQPISKSFRQIDFLIPLNTGCTLIEPCKTIYRELPKLISPNVPSLSFACGFHLSDIHDVGPSVVAYGYNQIDIDTAVSALAAQIKSKQEQFHAKIWPVDDGIAEAKSIQANSGGTVVIADTQDNPGGGGAGDTIGVLRAMVEQGLEHAVIGVINDKEVAAMSHQAGIGAALDIEIGGRAGIEGQDTLPCRATVINLSDGSFTATGPMYKGAHMQLGATALLDIGGVLVVVCSKAVQTADQAHFRHLGIEPAAMHYVTVKSSVHFRNDFEDLASKILIVSAPGEVYADPATLDYQNIRPGIQITAMA